ncbi:MAG: hypothetical protein HKN85_01835, partial [Gammaproteobacteria bacterium]|nr:hypothetical protein [Gammaproteobacteria bacterium]
MKLIAKFLGGLLLLYILFWLAVAAYFSFAARHKDLLETNLSSLFQRRVSIQQVRTAWQGMSPKIQVNGFQVAGDTPGQPALAFASMSAEFSAVSLLRFWPQLTKFAVEQPSLEIVSLPSNQLQIAGITLGTNRSRGINPKSLISWLLNHQNAVWLDGEIVWRRLDGQQQRYSNVSFVYQRDVDNRQISAATLTPKGPFAFKAQTNGNVLEAGDWDAAFEVLGDKGQSLLAPEDLSLVVENGHGSLQLKTLDMQRIQDFLLITGLGEAASWVLDSQLDGRLHDVRFDFSGPLLEFVDWSLTALASEVRFNPKHGMPGMSKLAGMVEASASGGTFEFSASEGLFKWPNMFASSFDIDQASGQFHWSIADNRNIEIVLENGSFEDQVARIWDLNASCNVDTRNRSVSNLAQLFKVDSVADLSFDQGKIIESGSVRGDAPGPLHLDANAKFEIKSLPEVIRYLPSDPRIAKFRTWWSNGVIQGKADGGVLSYQGELSKNALKVGKAELFGKVNFSGVELDYGYQRSWPKLLNSSGSATLENDLLTFIPEQAWLDSDRILDSKVTIDSIFYRERQLDLHARMTTSLPRVMTFLFDGPLLKPEQRGRPLPVTAQSGQVAAEVELTIPLANVRKTRVRGTADVTNGQLILPQGVAVTEVSTRIDFTERSAESAQIDGSFLGGPARAKLITTKAAQPPIMKITATGQADIKRLQPWLGEHILSWLDGTSEWQGDVSIDGPRVAISAQSDLQGVSVSAPDPLAKAAPQARPISVAMLIGDKKVPRSLALKYGENLRVRFTGDLKGTNSLFDRSVIWLGEAGDERPLKPQPGVNFKLDYNQLD